MGSGGFQLTEQCLWIGIGGSVIQQAALRTRLDNQRGNATSAKLPHQCLGVAQTGAIRAEQVRIRVLEFRGGFFEVQGLVHRALSFDGTDARHYQLTLKYIHAKHNVC